MPAALAVLSSTLSPSRLRPLLMALCLGAAAAFGAAPASARGPAIWHRTACTTNG